MKQKILINYFNVTYKIEWHREKSMRFNCYGKCWPIATTCILFAMTSDDDEEIEIARATVVKHKYDKDQIEYALRNSLTKLFKKHKENREIRRRLYTELKENMDKFKALNYGNG